ncbi:Ran-binding proteins 9/10 [Tetrabaena socialis]|uniref:Ran-binding proteins 9/10 n=1 Tax=Tetrabaena socialis TaxID=47790 RepID=A0A2J8A6Z9_9CHLO|nr:Ran-binding proteins 9/10 [Tetrabaena socialis]|eukprot:PNH08263.1 Ran-binding proteins 9/10 [Tetrabaena socialis]
MASSSGASSYYNSRCSLPSAWEPRVLSERPSLDFRLRVQMFVEMVAAAAAGEAAAAPGEAAAGEAAAGPGPGTGGGTAATGSGRAGTVKAEPMELEASGGGGGSTGPVAAAEAAAGAGAASAGPAPEPSGGDGTAGQGGGDGGGAAAAVPPASAPRPPSTREILSYGSAELWPRCRTAQDRELLTDALSLLAFRDPAASPAAYLLRPSHRVSLAEELNGAMLATRGLPATSPLERLYQHAAAALSELKRGDHPQALALPDARSLILDPPPPTPAPTPHGAAGPSGSGAAPAPMTD